MLGGLLGAVALGGHAWAQGICGLATLQGTYVYHQNGADLRAGQPAVVAMAGTETFTGAGTVRGVLTQSLNGQVTRRVRYIGTYTVAPSCLGTLSATDENAHPISRDLFLGPEGTAFTFVTTDPGVATGGSAQRVNLLRNPGQ